MGWSIDPVFEWTAALALAGVFGWSAVGKLTAFRAFHGVVANYRILPAWPWLVVVAAGAIPVLELAAGVGLLVPPARHAAAWLVLGLLAAFTLALIVNLARGRTHIDCGCFRAGAGSSISWALVARNGLMGCATVLVLGGHGVRALHPVDYLTVAGGAIALALLGGATPMLSQRLPGRGQPGGWARAEAGND